MEASACDPTAGSNRQELLAELPLLVFSKDAEDLAAKILAGHMLPQKSSCRRVACCRCGTCESKLFADLKLYSYRERP